MEETTHLLPADEPTTPDSKTVMARTAPEPEPAREAFIGKWLERIKAAEKKHEQAFKRMREDMQYARMGADDQWVAQDNYTANIIQRHINQSVAALYAKNPRAVAKRRVRMDFELWDGDQNSLMAAAADPMNPNNMMLLMDVQNATAQRKMIDRVCKTLEIMFHYYLDEQTAGFKKRMKRMVRRALVTGVGYVEMGFQRILESNPEILARLEDVQKRLDVIEARSADLADGIIRDDMAEAEELRQAIQVLQAEADIVVREGLVFDFPKSTDIIIDPRCTELMGFVGADWIARKMHKTPDEVKEDYKVDIGNSFTSYRVGADGFVEQGHPSSEQGKGMACIYHVQHKSTGMVFTLCDGYKDYLIPPAPPKVKLERFFNVYALTFNDVEDEREIFPNSDVSLIKPMQVEYNRARQGLREHRISNKPRWAVSKGSMDEGDKDKLASGRPFSVLELNVLAAGEKIADKIQPIPTAELDPALYDTAPSFEDVQRTVGAQEANLGGTSGATATESSIAEGSRATATASNVDDLDDLLTDIARDAGQVMLQEVSVETVKKIAGPGAVWPEMNRQEIAEEIVLQIKAGSSGRPNKAQELANRERAMPLIIQIPGINPLPLARQYLDLLDIDLDEAIAEGLPSITSMNRQSQPSTGDPATDPNQQGEQGGQNAEAPQERQQGPQPAYPAPNDTPARQGRPA